MDHYLPYLVSIKEKKEWMTSLVLELSSIHSGSYHLEGLNRALNILRHAYAPLNGEINEIQLPPKKEISTEGVVTDRPLGKALMISKHKEAKLQLLLGGHMDIALPKESALPNPVRMDDDVITGRGTADMKGGLVIMLAALRALEESPFASQIGWTVLINPDEEIGSPGSAPLWQELAKKADAAFLFEPTFPDGSLVSSRKGSANYTVVIKGKAAHAGREFHRGQNALTSCARFALAAERLTDLEKELTINIGYINGGGPTNVIPDRAIMKLNVRSSTPNEMNIVKKKLDSIAEIENHRDDLKATIFQDSERPPKQFDRKTRTLFESLKTSARALNIDVQWKSSGGVCDGNLTAIQGTPTIDTLGAIGGNLHTDEEYLLISSLTERATLAARFIMQIAAGEVIIP